MHAHQIFRLAGIQGNVALLVLSSLVMAPLLAMLLVVFTVAAGSIKLADWLAVSIRCQRLAGSRGATRRANEVAWDLGGDSGWRVDVVQHRSPTPILPGQAATPRTKITSTTGGTT